MFQDGTISAIHLCTVYIHVFPYAEHKPIHVCYMELYRDTAFNATDASLHKSPSVKKALKKNNTTGTVCLKDITCAPHGQCEKPRALCEEPFFWGQTAPLELSWKFGIPNSNRGETFCTPQNEQQ